jgi:hypothetical protein
MSSRQAKYLLATKSQSGIGHFIPAVAINLLRIAYWASGTPVAQTRCSHFRGSPISCRLNSPPVSILLSPRAICRLVQWGFCQVDAVS